MTSQQVLSPGNDLIEKEDSAGKLDTKKKNVIDEQLLQDDAIQKWIQIDQFYTTVPMTTRLDVTRRPFFLTAESCLRVWSFPILTTPRNSSSNPMITLCQHITKNNQRLANSFFQFFFWDGKAESRHQKRVVTQKQRCASLGRSPRRVPGIRQDVGRGGSDVVGTLTSPSFEQRQRAALHANIVPHLECHACRARALRCGASPRTLALANWRRKLRHSSDHLPATSVAKTTSFVLPNWPLSSGYVVSFRRRAVSRAAPSVVAHRGRGVPSLLSTDTSVVSTANWVPWNRGKPSATISRRRLSKALGRARSISWTRTLSETLAPASLQTRAAALSTAKPPATQNPSHCTSCAVMATGIEWEATPAVASGRRKREPQATVEEHPKRLSVESGVCSSGETREWQTCNWATWRTEEGTGGEGEAGHRAPLKKQSSTFWAAPNCHPCRFTPGSPSSSSCYMGMGSLWKSSHGDASKLTSKRRSLQLATASRFSQIAFILW